MSNVIAGLLTEREGYVRRGLKDRVKQVDEALAALGHKVRAEAPQAESATVEVESERAVVPRASKRRG